MSQLTIPEDIYNRIMTAMGYPITSEEDLGITRDQIEDLLILPAMKNVYFKWFPKQEEDAYNITTTFDIPFPDEYTWGIVDLRLNTKPYYSTVKTGNPLINDLNIRSSTVGMGRNMWDSGNDYGYTQAYYAERAYRQSVIDTYRGFKKTIDYSNRKVKGYTNTTGQLSLIWAKWSDKWEDVDFRFEEDLIKLSQSYILQYFGQLRNQISTASPDDIDGGNLVSRAEDLYNEVMDKWKQYPRISIIRS